MITVRQLLRDKPDDVWTIEPQDSVYMALEVMADKNLGALVVVEEGKVVGMFSERDYARKVILKGRSSKSTSVRELMDSKVCYISPEQTMKECMALFTDKRIRHLPVLDEGQLIGLVSIGDVVKRIVTEQEFTIKQLENYITGSF